MGLETYISKTDSADFKVEMTVRATWAVKENLTDDFIEENLIETLRDRINSRGIHAKGIKVKKL